MTLAPTVDPAEARAALATAAGRLTALLRTSTRPGAHAIGVWDVADTAVHLGNAWDILPALARGERPPLIDDVWELGDVTTRLTRAATDHDLNAIADRIDAAARSFLDLAATSDGSVRPWLVSGVEVPMTTFVCHLLNESLVHGFDISRAQDRAWAIERAHARLIIQGFLFPVLSRLPAAAMVDAEAASGVRACYDLRLRGGGRFFMAFEDGEMSIEAPSSRRVDCHVLAEPSALLLVIWGRRSQWPAIFSGKLLTYGRRPWLGHRLRTLVRNP
jgi:SCP-2 sterol transfer family protein